MQRRFHSLEDIRSSGISCVALVEFYLQKIKEKNQKLNAFIETWDDQAMEKAKKVDQNITNGKAGKLAGMVLGIKDNLLVRGHMSSNSSKILTGFTSPYRSTFLGYLSS